ncbi:hypothetical protein CLM85_10870 [Streptomyces albidoflavus]|uniref:hypothetical protein n=1 Tax=Streptomyces albidoflavus TaxID=1886 RepID=UPI000BAE3D48|nr:hypothetical protein [Streptomyces albidoflavus]PAX83127.1 hypothetical protein CLM81_23940 [Streptomyces albidoflavus]PAX89627.1 hypothetical protein CLM82_20165 [Streptomyces albidoflavus]PBO20389.1 hypothetical protein CLM83_00825 [Streptomyces albidoflavus]PBO24328.1 hypothetical protein CLM85_10870 [Streptomyces albidoflavus]PBO31724.1 hypothetical protein CLM84_00925 [Streptomyces albidoflavus]
MPRERVLAAVGYAALALLCLAAMAWTVFTGIARLTLSGNAVEVRLTECHRDDGARNTTHTACGGPSPRTTDPGTIEVRYEGRQGETIRVARTPWGRYEAVDTGFVSWGIAVLAPLLPLGAAAATGALAVREIRRARRTAGSGRAA